jgi:hypothetical protein
MFLWMIHMDFLPQIFLGGITAIFLGVMTFLIYAMDHPLQGAVSVGAEPFQSVFDLVMKWDGTAGTGRDRSGHQSCKGLEMLA